MQRPTGTRAYASTVYGVSPDGLVWEDWGEALGKGVSGDWDGFKAM